MGSPTVSVYLIKTDKGLILLDVGYAEDAAQVEKNIQALGFKLKDVKILLENHAHRDHVGGLAKLIGENEFPNQFHEGQRDSLYMTIVGQRVVLVVIFDNRTSLGLVRLRIKKASDELTRIFEALLKKTATPGIGSPFAEISDADIDNLFSE